MSKARHWVEMITEDLIAERIAIDSYREMIAHVLFVIFVIFAIVSLVMGKRPPA